MTSADIEAIWVVSDVTPDGTYVVTIQAGPDVAVTLDRGQALEYAATVMQAAARAEYDAAVYRQMRAMGLDKVSAVQAVADLRQDRPPLDAAATAPFGFEPLVMASTFRPAVYLSLKGERIAQWKVAEVQGHAMHVLDVLAGVDLDSAYRRFLTGVIGTDDARARAAVGDIANHRHRSTA